MMATALSTWYEVVSYPDGPSGLTGIQEQPPAAVLMDIGMSNIDGIMVLHAIRSDPDLALIPVIAVTAHAMHGDKEKFLAEGFDDYIPKPIHEIEDLHRAIEAQLQGKRSL